MNVAHFIRSSLVEDRPRLLVVYRLHVPRSDVEEPSDSNYFEFGAQNKLGRLLPARDVVLRNPDRQFAMYLQYHLKSSRDPQTYAALIEVALVVDVELGVNLAPLIRVSLDVECAIDTRIALLEQIVQVGSCRDFLEKMEDYGKHPSHRRTA